MWQIWREERCICGVGLGILRRENWEDVDIAGWIIVKWILEGM
jgi:hypothetical protein